MNQLFTLHPQLTIDTHNLINHDDYFILLHKNASIPWVIIVPKTQHLEIFDLPEDILCRINALTQSITQIFKKEFSSEKMNIAAIGNMVPQLHIHIIGRKAGDSCWPGVVWGADYPFTEYTSEQIKKLQLQLSKTL
jgi:diadenosine tetraphosphate (Ap4A) HIT family hydrolase